MSGTFSEQWLLLREHFDQPARAAASAAFDLRALARRLRPDGAPLELIDLACGSGANLRHLAPRLGGAQRWTLIDNDAELLAAVPQRIAAWARERGLAIAEEGAEDVGVVAGPGGGAAAEWRGRLRVEGQGWNASISLLRLDLAQALDSVPLPPSALLTASALLDLVSAAWLARLVARLRPSAGALLFALDVDGRIDWQPALSGDPLLARLFGAHQLRDKGFGAPALGPSAAAAARHGLAAAGWRCAEARSDWVVDGSSGEPALRMLRAMIEGIAGAALEQSAADGPAIAAWKAERLQCLHTTCLQVGHVDLLCEFA